MKQKIGFIAEVKVNFPGADFWLVRKGSEASVGQPVEFFNREFIGLRFNAKVAVARYYFYVMQIYYQTGVFERLAKGTLQLKHITVDDVIELDAHPS